MQASISYVMHYSRRRFGAEDWVGGLPTHLPHVWPRCQKCQSPMAFVGQIYATDWFQLDGHLGLHVYVCDEHRKTIQYPHSRKSFTISETLHLELLSYRAAKNTSKQGIKCKSQPRLYIRYELVEDSMDQESFQRQRLAEDELRDKHLRQDKIGGLFPYDGYDGPKITKKNRLIAQVHWAGIGGTMYLYHSVQKGIYPFRCW